MWYLFMAQHTSLFREELTATPQQGQRPPGTLSPLPTALAVPGRRARYPAGRLSCSLHAHCGHTRTLVPERSTSPAQCTCLETGPGRCILWWGLPCVHHSPLCIIDTGHHHHSARHSHGLEVPAACPPGSVRGPGPGRGIGRASGRIPGQPHAPAHQRPCLPDCWGRAELRPAAPARRDGPSCSWRLLAQRGAKQHKPWDSPHSGITPTAVLQGCSLPTSWRQAGISDWRALGRSAHLMSGAAVARRGREAKGDRSRKLQPVGHRESHREFRQGGNKA